MTHVKVCLGKAAWHEGWEAKEARVEQLSIVSWALGPAALAWLNRVQFFTAAPSCRRGKITLEPQ